MCLPEEPVEQLNSEACHDHITETPQFLDKYSLEGTAVDSVVTAYACQDGSSSFMAKLPNHNRNLGDFQIEADPKSRVYPSLGFSNKQHVVEVNDSSKLELLARKFNNDVANIWSTTEPSSDAWTSKVTASVSLLSLEDSGSLSNIWSFSPGTSCSHEVSSSSSSHLSSPVNHPVNHTSLKNHTEESPFIQVSTSRASNAISQHDSRASSSNENHVIGKKRNKKSSMESKENLLTSLQTHFQPIRQDYYERGPNNVTDTQLSGLVPCSGKCPNHARNRCDIRNSLSEKVSCDPRPSSVSREELSLIVGPFKEDEEDVQLEAEDNQESQVDQKELCDKQNTEEKEVRETDTVTPAVDDYDAICSILNQVLNNQSPSCDKYEHLIVPPSPQVSSQVDHGIPSFDQDFLNIGSYSEGETIPHDSYQSYIDIDHLSGSEDALHYEAYSNDEGYPFSFDATTSSTTIYDFDAASNGHVEWSLGNHERDASPKQKTFFPFQPKIGMLSL